MNIEQLDIAHMNMTSLALAALAGYLLGAIPFGMVLTWLSGGGDIRSSGSGNIGATNVLRTGGKGLAALTLLLDAGKAILAVWLARHFLSEGVPGDVSALLAGFAAFLGHVFPLWLRFRGGKGVATMIGALLGLAWPVGLAFCAVWLLTAILRRQSSLASITAAATAPLFAWWLGSPLLALTALALALILISRHHENISRLLAGTEPRIGQ